MALTKTRWILLGVGFVAIAAGAAGWFVFNHTAWLRPRTENSVIVNNNFNPVANVNAAVDVATLTPQPTGIAGRSLNLPNGFTVKQFAGQLDGPRFFAVLAPGVLVVANKGAGELVWLKGSANGSSTERKVIDRNLRNVHSVVWADGTLYVGEEHRVSAYSNFTVDGGYDQKSIIVNNLPAGAGHVTRTVSIGPDKKLYVSIGSSCNVCQEKDERRAAIMQYNLDGTGGRIFARGLRNSVGLAWRGTELWSVDNGRDLLGDNLPPEEVNLIRDGGDYGWPYCYGNRIPNPEFADRTTFCTNQSTGPEIEMPAHSAPLGLAVIPSTFSPTLSDRLLIAFHGSWNRTERTGYKLVWANPEKPENGLVNFATGWLESGGVWGRPVGLGFDAAGTLYVSDDYADVIYSIQPSS